MNIPDFEEIIVNKFCEESAKKFRAQVLKRASLDTNMPIVIYIDSYGGYIDSLNTMLDVLEQVSNPIVTVCTGKAMSCGAVLLAAGDFRFCGRNSRVMVHQGSSGAGGPIESLQNDVDESKRINKQMMHKIAERCGMNLSVFKKEMKSRLHRDDDEARDLYLPPEAAKEIGIVDFIGMPIIKPVVMYSIEPSLEKKYSLDKVSSDLDLEETILNINKLTKLNSSKKKTTKSRRKNGRS